MKRFLISGLIILTLSSSALADAVDLFKIAIGARAMGMGGTGLTLPEADAVFLNPGSLGGMDSWQAGSMFCSLLGEVNYTVANAAYPASFGTLGAAYVGAMVTGVPVTSGYDPQTGEPTITGRNYADSITALSYGLNLRRFKNLNLPLSIGASLKLFNKSMSGAADSANGTDIDAGLLWQPAPWLGVGVTLRNILPASAGGVVSWSTGRKEGVPAAAKFGVGARLKDYLLAEADVDASINRGLPLPLHLGLELTPVPELAFRLGIDQEIDPPRGGSGNSTVLSDITFGLGLMHKGFHFDYAYHPYHVLADNATHYFSVSYWNPVKEALTSEVKPKVIMSPQEYRKTFPDTRGHWAERTISRMAGLGIVEGRPDGLFHPNDTIIKVEAAKMVMRINRLKESLPRATVTYRLSGGSGRDYSVESGIYDEKSVLVKLLEKDKSITFGTYKIIWDGKGEGDRPALAGNYNYRISVRAENRELQSCGTIEVATLLRIYSVTEEGIPAFTDVKKENFWGTSIIAETTKLNLMEGDTPDLFRPYREITRLELVEAIGRALALDGYKFPKELSLPYYDADKIPEGAKKYAALYVGILGAGGENGYLKPRDLITRAEAAAILERYLASKFPE